MLDWIEVSQTNRIDALNKTEVGKSLGFAGLGWDLTDRSTASSPSTRAR